MFAPILGLAWCHRDKQVLCTSPVLYKSIRDCFVGPIISFICLAEIADNDKYLCVRVGMLSVGHFIPTSLNEVARATSWLMQNFSSSHPQKQMPIETWNGPCPFDGITRFQTSPVCRPRSGSKRLTKYRISYGVFSTNGCEIKSVCTSLIPLNVQILDKKKYPHEIPLSVL